MIVANCAKALESTDIIVSKNAGLYTSNTTLRWSIVGPVNGISRRKISCNRIGVRQADTNKVGKNFFQAKTIVKKADVKEGLARLYNQECTESGSPEGKQEN